MAPVAPGRDLRTFSGGNQQKVVLAKWLDRAPTALLLDEPVHGVDVASRAQIFARLAALAGAGTAIVVASIATTTSSRSVTPCSWWPTGGSPLDSTATP
ncbi:MAG: ATP-binding cassette domain-containing protein [Pseudonocardiaceae bacterium]